MSRHRNIRNVKHYDYDDDDYDVYGHSYEDDYGVSPGTMAQYSYSSGRGVQFSSYIPSEEPVQEETYECEENQSENVNLEKSVHSTPLNVTRNGVSSSEKNFCLEKIRDAVGDHYSDNAVSNAALKCNYDPVKATDFLLTSPDAPSPYIRTGMKTYEKNNLRDNVNVASSSGVSMPQRTKHRGRRGTAHQKNSPVLVISGSPKAVENKNIKTTKVETNKLTPVKKGFDIPSNSKKQPSVPEGRRYSDFAVDKTEFGPKSNPSTPLRKLSLQTDTLDARPSTTGKQSKNQINYKLEYESRQKNEKQQISMVVIGHVDAGKSTMMGHLLFQKGIVSKRIIHKYEQESKKVGKSSFAYAWVLDETGEERARGVTMDVAHNHFETDNRVVALMDAPGHRDFIPNMITGASQADVAVLVVGSTTGEFEAGFGIGGQTREHALLVRSLGVAQLAVAVNKLDVMDWSQQRFNDIVKELKQFLKQAGFKEDDVTYVPVSGLLGENLIVDSKEPLLKSWYKGPCLLKVIDQFRSPPRPVEYPFRFCVNDVYRGQGSGIYVSGKIESGGVSPNVKVMVMPAGEKGLVKGVESNDEKGRVEFALVGEHATLVLHGVDMMKINRGSVICDIDNPIRAITKLQASIIVFNIEVPITRGFPVELHYKAVSEPAVIKRLISQNKSNGDVLVKKPKVILKGHKATVNIEVARPVCLEEYSKLKELGRFTLRYGGSTIAACVVTKLL